MSEQLQLSYDPSTLPTPVSVADFYLLAILVELRAQRKVLERVALLQDKQTKLEAKASRQK